MDSGLADSDSLLYSRVRTHSNTDFEGLWIEILVFVLCRSQKLVYLLKLGGLKKWIMLQLVSKEQQERRKRGVKTAGQCWSESRLVSLAVSPSPQSQSPSQSPSGVSPSPLD